MNIPATVRKMLGWITHDRLTSCNYFLSDIFRNKVIKSDTFLYEKIFGENEMKIF